ncbi:MAG TPA: bifunctional heptose 7-phosphate kinase/heptose 1-phosphate adenyltransferase [Pirellulales bacterium]|nr:bifunctional heptose 7-phosphate kinase/heptose 1-phosphate adenyltransferase [Pirellulales bacterium]
MKSIDLVETLQGIGCPRALVLGDLMLDRYTQGNVDRISPEAPVMILQADHREARPGGAANVANMLATLGSQVTCCGVVGEDAAGQELCDLLGKMGVSCELVVAEAGRVTTVKERIVGLAGTRHPSQLLRVDSESRHPLVSSTEAHLIDAVCKSIGDYDVVLISDYGKGVCTPAMLEATIAAAQRRGVPVLVDPCRGSDCRQYHGATLVKPNRSETEQATGIRVGTMQDAITAGVRLCKRAGLRMALVTLDRDGMVLVQADGQGEAFPTCSRKIYDITGAGDMVLSMLGLCFGAGTSIHAAVRLANVAAGLEVERPGVAVLGRDEITSSLAADHAWSTHKIVTLDEARRLAEEYRRQGLSTVFTNGCFDLLHVGHIANLNESAALGHRLFVALNSDSSVRKLKGPGRPLIHDRDRAVMVAALAVVSHVLVFDDPTPQALIEAIRPNVLVKGGSYTADEVVGADFVRSYGGEVHLASMVQGISTTQILAAMQKQHEPIAAPIIHSLPQSSGNPAGVAKRVA